MAGILDMLASRPILGRVLGRFKAPETPTTPTETPTETPVETPVETPPVQTTPVETVPYEPVPVPVTYSSEDRRKYFAYNHGQNLPTKYRNWPGKHNRNVWRLKRYINRQAVKEGRSVMRLDSIADLGGPLSAFVKWAKGRAPGT